MGSSREGKGGSDPLSDEVNRGISRHSPGALKVEAPRSEMLRKCPLLRISTCGQ